MGDRKDHSRRGGKKHKDAGAPRHGTPLNSDTDMFGAPSLWCKKTKKTHHRSEAKDHRSGKGENVGEKPRQKHRSFYSPLSRFFRMTSDHRHQKTMTPTCKPRARHGFGLGYTTPPPPPPPLKQSSPYTSPRYLHSQMTPTSFRRTPYHTPVSPVEDSPSGFSASGTPGTTSSSKIRPPSNPPLNPNCESCFKTHHLNASLRQSLLAQTRELYTLLQKWSDEAGVGDDMTPIDPMEWQPEKAAVVIEKERRPSEMCRVLMKMGSVEDWVRVMRGLEENEGGQKMVGVKEGLERDGEDMMGGEGDENSWFGGIGGDSCLRYRRMAVDEGGGMG